MLNVVLEKEILESCLYQAHLPGAFFLRLFIGTPENMSLTIIITGSLLGLALQTFSAYSSNASTSLGS